MYGLKQSPRQWYKRFDSFILDNSFIRSGFDIKKSSVCIGIYLLLHVNDMLVASNSKSEVLMVKDLLKNEFEMKDMGSALQDYGCGDKEE